MDKIFDVIVIGGGPAGYSAALYATRAGYSTLVIEKLSPGGQMALTGNIENYPGFVENVDGFELGMRMMQQAESFGAKTEYAEVVSVSLNDNPKTITTTSGDYLAKSVVIATGATAKLLGIPNEKEYVGKGIHYCAHCDGYFYKDKEVVVVGGGNSAITDAIYLSKIAKKVTIVHRRDEFRATRVYQEALLKCENIDIMFDSIATEILSESRADTLKLKNVKTDEEQIIHCDGIFVSIGRKPVSEFLIGQIELDELGYIIADESTKTNISGVFAVGDVRKKALRQIVTAVADGAVAVHYIEEYMVEN